jgi:hypothetical protein
MQLGITVVLVNFGIIALVFVLGKIVDAMAERYDSRQD